MTAVLEPAAPVRASTSMWRTRADAWSVIADASKRLAAPATPADQHPVLRVELDAALDVLDVLERFWARPGTRGVARVREWCQDEDYAAVLPVAQAAVRPDPGDRPAFQVLVVDDSADALALEDGLIRARRPEDRYVYQVVAVPSFEDALLAVLLNADIQACVIRPGFTLGSPQPSALLGHYQLAPDPELTRRPADEVAVALGRRIAELRPELDLFVMAQGAIETTAARLGRHFRRIFDAADTLELHLSILRGVAARHGTPFFTALRDYSRQPTGVFHALPISRGHSVTESPWISQVTDFYGLNIFLAETSATSGGLDSLLEPAGTMKQAQELAARAFGAQRTYFVTNGTSTANKIVSQSLVAPGDVVLVDRNCHKSHHYALMLAGARVAYLESYALDEYSMYGAVPTATIVDTLREYERAGRLDEVRMLSLTNCTFDGIVYDVERVMAECLAIKPDLVFLWDEAWFAFARFHPIYRQRTAMAAAARLARRFADDPRVRIRVYATQSTHKTLTSLRQGSMIHVHDQDFHESREAFLAAYMTHTSTSPNYQILASLDAGRAQAELEGFKLVERQAELAMELLDATQSHPLISKYFRVLTTPDMIPPEFRTSGITAPSLAGWSEMDRAWREDEFVRDPSRLTLFIGLTGVDGDTFKHDYLMARHGIQVNKTSRNSVLFMTNIGTTRSAVAHLIEVLASLAEEFDEERSRMGELERTVCREDVARLTRTPPPLPNFSAFAERYRPDPGSADGDVRAAFYDSYRRGACTYAVDAQIRRRLAAGDEVVSANFVTPYPPGFPVLVPGQVITLDILDYLAALDTKEIHGFDGRFGFRIFTDG